LSGRVKYAECLQQQKSGGTMGVSFQQQWNSNMKSYRLTSGLAVIDINAYKELIIRVRDAAQRPLANSIISLIRWQVEGSLDLHLNEGGEFTMLLLPGRYGTRAPGGPPVQFEVTDEDPDQRTIELEAPVTL